MDLLAANDTVRSTPRVGSVRVRWIGLSALASAVLIVTSLTVTPHAPHEALWFAADAVILCWAIAGAWTLAPAPHLGALVSVGSVLAAAAAMAARLADAGTDHGNAHVVAILAAPLAMAVAIHALLALPDGRLVERSRRVAGAITYAAALAVGGVLAATSHVFVPWPVDAVWAVAIVATLPALHARYVVATASGRQRIQSLAAGVVLALIVAVAALTLHLLVRWPEDVAPALVAASALLPIGTVAGSLPAAAHADRLFVRLLEALGLVVVVAATYLVVLRGFGQAPSNARGRETLGLSIAAGVAAALIYLAARGRVERVATRLTYGAREAPDEVVRSFGTRLTRAIPMDELLLQLVESLRKTLALASAEIYTGTGEVLDLAVSVPDAGAKSIRISGEERAVIARAGVSGNAWTAVWIPSVLAGRTAGPLRVAPISHAGELLGVIVIARPEGAVGFREEDDRVLTELARQVGLALHNAQLDTALQSSLDELRRQADELRASRARIVASGDAERRRVERNLHDGAQQHLVALAINLRLAKDIVAEDPPAAMEMLDELGVAVQDTIKELRELAHGIYPPLLVDSGLPEALRAVANRSPLDVELTTDGIGRYGRDTEAAIYFCCLEALQNAGKHAPQSHVTVRVWEESGGLLFEVRDDGPGFDVTLAQRGHGYTNMADRLGAIGGAVRWESRPGHGTTIRGSVPLG
jgi:signal transduction histidine kinase